jgi:hypothetical protein
LPLAAKSNDLNQAHNLDGKKLNQISKSVLPHRGRQLAASQHNRYPRVWVHGDGGLKNKVNEVGARGLGGVAHHASDPGQVKGVPQTWPLGSHLHLLLYYFSTIFHTERAHDGQRLRY